MINNLRVLAQRAFLLAGLSLIASQAQAQQAGSLDAPFNPGASAISSFSNLSVFSGSVTGIALQGDGAAIVGGNFFSANGVNRGYLARVDANGALDGGYNAGQGFNDIVRTVVLQPDGRALVGGFFTQFDGPANPQANVQRIARLNPDGSLDAGFNPAGSGPNSSVRAVAVQADGQVLVGGFFTSFSNGGNAVPANRIARLDAVTGALDPSFNPGGIGADDSVETLDIQDDGAIVIGGAFTNYNNVSRSRLARLNANGTLDPTFVTPFFNAPVRSLAVQADGRIVVAGDFAIALEGVTSRGIARLNANGSIDPTFAPGAGANNNVQTVELQADGRILIGGDFTTVNGVAGVRVARLNVNGSLDATFNPGAGANSTVRAFAIQANGSVLVGGDFSLINGAVEIALGRVTPAGAVDGTFSPGGQGFGFTATDVAALALSKNKIYVGGNFGSINGNGRRNIDRLNSDGSPDSGFNPGAGTDGIVRAIVPDPNGGVFIGGDFLRAQNLDNPGVAHLKADGSADLFFSGGQQTDGAVRAMALSPAGLVIGGDFTQYDGQPYSGIVRIDAASGVADPLFNSSGAGADNSVRAIAIQPVDGKILIGGDFRSFNGVARNFYARLLSNGTLDPSFNTGAGANGSIDAIALQIDGRILIGGAFSTVGGAVHRGVARLNADGTVDPTFVTALDANGMVDALTIQPDGKIVVGGNFISASGARRSNIARLNADGSVDPTFDPGAGTNSSVHALLVKPNGKTVIGGTFSAVGGAPRARLAQLNGDTAPGTVQFTADSFTGLEANGGVGLTVSRTGGAAGAVSVSYTTADGSATGGADYTPISGTLTWAAGDLTNKSIAVPISTDAVAEPTETFSVVLSSPNDDVNLGSPSRATANIIDNPPASLQFTQATYTGNEGPPFGSITVAVARRGNSVGAVSVDFQLRGVTAVGGGNVGGGVDFFTNNGTLTWADGDTSPKTFVVTIVNDLTPEPDETLQAVLSNPLGAAVLGTPSVATLTIKDDDAAPILQFSNATFSVNEGAGNAVVTVTRSGSNIGQVSVDYVTTTDGTATENVDYTPKVGTLTWTAGDLSPKSFLVPILNDTVRESAETVSITLGNATGGALVGPTSTATLTIVDDDMPSTVQFSAATYNSPAGSSQAIVTVTRQGGSGAAISVNYATANGTAVAGTDYTSASGTLNWAVGDQAAKTFIVPILNNSVQAEPKAFTVALSLPTGTTLGTVSTATVTILGQATPVVTVVAKKASVTEGQGKGNFVITRTGGDLNVPLVVRFQLKGGAQVGVDYAGVGKKVTIPAGASFVKVKIAAFDDGISDTNEKVKMVLTATSDYTLGSPAVAVIVIRDGATK